MSNSVQQFESNQDIQLYAILTSLCLLRFFVFYHTNVTMPSPPDLRNDSQSELIDVKGPSIENRAWPRVATYGNSISWNDFEPSQAVT